MYMRMKGEEVIPRIWCMGNKQHLRWTPAMSSGRYIFQSLFWCSSHIQKPRGRISELVTNSEPPASLYFPPRKPTFESE